MITSFRITEEVSDNAVNFGHIESPRVNPSNSIITYDFSGDHLGNVSTYPGQSRLLTASFSDENRAWYLRSLYASDGMITNKVIARRGIKRSIPLYFQYISDMPVLSSAYFDNTTGYVVNRDALLNEYSLISREGVTVPMTEYLHDVEFIPYHQHRGTIFDETHANKFFIRILSNGAPKARAIKLKFKASRIDLPGHPPDGDHDEFISLEQIYNLYNINYSFAEGVGSDLIGHAYPDARLSPIYKLDPTNPIPEDPDVGFRSKNEYSLLYNYQDRSYQAILESPNESTTPFFAVYYSGVAEINSGDQVVSFETVDNSIFLILTEPNDVGRQFRVLLSGRSSFDVAFEINESNIPFQVYETLRLENMDLGNVFTEYAGLTADGGVTVLSKNFISRYLQDPTIQALPPVDVSNKVEWHPRVKLGGYVDEEGRAYYINEFSSQEWSKVHGFPYKDVQGEFLKFIDDTTIQLSNRFIFNEKDQIYIFDSAGQDLSENIIGLDAFHGRVYLQDRLITNNELFISYSYREKFFTMDQLNLNPSPPFNGEIGRYYSVVVDPFISNSFRNPSTLRVVESDSLPASTHIGDSLVLASFFIHSSITEQDYKFTPPATRGGGIRGDIPLSTLLEKIPDLESMFDFGLLDGIRYPANSVIHFQLPEFLKGKETILLQDYDPTSIDQDSLVIYNAVNLEPGQTLKIFPGNDDTIFEDFIILGPTSSNTVKLSAPLASAYNAGSRVTIDKAPDALFSSEEIREKIRKFASASSYHIVEYE